MRGFNGLGCTVTNWADPAAAYYDGDPNTPCGAGFDAQGNTIVGVQNSVNTLAAPSTTPYGGLFGGFSLNPWMVVVGIVVLAAATHKGR